MKSKKASDTAGYTSAMRAIANLAPKHKKYLHDPYSLEFLPFPWVLTTPFFLAKVFDPLIYSFGMKAPDKMVGFPGMTSLACLRHRFIDDQILQAYEQGVRRFVILGAGYDTRSLRLNLPEARLIEVDHPNTQARKKKIIKKKRLVPICKLEYVSIDFSQPWEETLFSDAVIQENSTDKTMVIWEGVSCYLKEQAVYSTIDTARQLLKNGGTLVFDAFVAELLKPDTHVDILKKMRSFVEKKGEPFLWAEDAGLLNSRLGVYGFKDIESVSIYELAASFAKKENIDIPKDEILKYLNMYVCCV